MAHLDRESVCHASSEITERQVELGRVGGEMAGTILTQCLFAFSGETEHSELLACTCVSVGGTCLNALQTSYTVYRNCTKSIYNTTKKLDWLDQQATQ